MDHLFDKSCKLFMFSSRETFIFTSVILHYSGARKEYNAARR